MGMRRTGRFGYIAPPERLPGVPEAERVRPKTRVAGRCRPRWVDRDGNIYEWDFSTRGSNDDRDSDRMRVQFDIPDDLIAEARKIAKVPEDDLTPPGRIR